MGIRQHRPRARGDGDLCQARPASRWADTLVIRERGTVEVHTVTSSYVYTARLLRHEDTIGWSEQILQANPRYSERGAMAITNELHR